MSAAFKAARTWEGALVGVLAAPVMAFQQAFSGLLDERRAQMEPPLAGVLGPETSG